MEENAKMISISVDEYFDLRQKAEMNGFLMERMGSFEERLRQTQDKIWELEQKVNK